MRKIPVVSGKVVVLDRNDKFVGFLDVNKRQYVKDINPTYKLFSFNYKSNKGLGSSNEKYVER